MTETRQPRHRRPGLRLAAAIGAAGLAGLVGVGVDLPAAQAAIDPGSTYKVSARADAMAVEFGNSAAPVFADDAIIYGTPATAISSVDSLGESRALAAAPYPGDLMIGAPDNGRGVVAQFGGPPEIVPTYPFYVHSSYPAEPDRVQDQSGNRLVAHSTQYASSSDARSGLITGDVLAALQAQASSRAVVDDVTGALDATADSRLDAFKLTERLQIGKSTAHARIVRQADGTVAKESAFTLGSINVSGFEMSYSDQGFKAGGASQPSQQFPAPFAEALKQVGITVEFLPATGTETSIESAGLRISQVQKLGPGTNRVAFIIGHVSARIEGTAKPAAGGLLEPLPASSPSPSPGPGLSFPPSPGAASPLSGGVELGPALTFSSAAPLPSLGPAVATPAGSPLPDVGALPAALDAVTSAAAGAPTQSAAPPAPPEVRLATAIAAGGGLRDDRFAGPYLALGAALAALALAAAGALVLGRGGAATTSVLRLPPG